MKTLYIIGNGFDLYHNLPTSYSHFKDYLNKKDNTSNTVSFLEYIFRGSLWSDFEKSIGRPKIDVVYRLSQEEEKRLPEFNKQKCALENICDALIQIKLLFTEWVTYVKCLQYKCWKKLSITANDNIFLTFNYTQTLENVYNIPNEYICYIHDQCNGANKDTIGAVLNTERYICGCDRNASIEIQSENETIVEHIKYMTKNVDEIIQSPKWQKFIDKIISVQQIFVIGHSVSEVDHPYFEKIKALVLNAQWYYACTEAYPEDNVKENLKSIGICAKAVLYTDI